MATVSHRRRGRKRGKLGCWGHDWKLVQPLWRVNYQQTISKVIGYSPQTSECLKQTHKTVCPIMGNLDSYKTIRHTASGYKQRYWWAQKHRRRVHTTTSSLRQIFHSIWFGRREVEGREEGTELTPNVSVSFAIFYLNTIWEIVYTW